MGPTKIIVEHNFTDALGHTWDVSIVGDGIYVELNGFCEFDMALRIGNEVMLTLFKAV